MIAVILIQLEYLLRMLVAAACGSLIGFERKYRLKEAGVRTHMLVALGAALIMIVSKYGFSDVINLHGYVLDPSRVAAQIVSGIGFLGAGMIFVKKQAVSGLTTAAGVWATAGIGMAIGSGLYFVGVAGTALLLLILHILYRNFKWLHLPVPEQISILFNDSNDAISYVQDRFKHAQIEIINLKAEKLGNGYLELELFVKLPQDYDISQLMNLFKDDPHVKSIEY